MNTKRPLLLMSILVVLMGLTGLRPAVSRATSSLNSPTEAENRAAAQVMIPKITKATIEKKQLIIEGENFGEGAKVLVNGAKVKTAPDEMSPTTKLIVNKAPKRLPVDEIVELQVKNPDGQLSAIQMFFTGLTLTYQNTNTGLAVTIEAGRKFLLYFNEPLFSWALFDPPQLPTVEFVESTQFIIFSSQGVFLAKQPGSTYFIMDGHPPGERPIRQLVGLVVE